jgi:ethanolamine ammonia-lyase small subunit
MSDELSKPLPTTARLSLGRDQRFVATKDQLDFRLDHALARDAVHAQLDVPALLSGLKARGLEPLSLRSAAVDRSTYLRRPDLGRTLSEASIAQLQNAVILSEAKDPESPDLDSAAQNLSAPETNARIAVILADGLSALAIERQALPLLDALLPVLPHLYPLVPIVANARVAVGDEIGQRLGAKLTVLLIGERPGLSSADSLGVYITWNPRTGRTDAERNCISNIRAEGLSFEDAARRILYFVSEAIRLQTSGTALKEPSLLLG